MCFPGGERQPAGPVSVYRLHDRPVRFLYAPVVLSQGTDKPKPIARRTSARGRERVTESVGERIAWRKPSDPPVSPLVKGERGTIPPLSGGNAASCGLQSAVSLAGLCRRAGRLKMTRTAGQNIHCHTAGQDRRFRHGPHGHRRTHPFTTGQDPSTITTARCSRS